jgi:hypothetical protein
MYKKSQIEKVLRDIENNIPYHRICIKLMEIKRNEQKQTSINDNDKKKA